MDGHASIDDEEVEEGKRSNCFAQTKLELTKPTKAQLDLQNKKKKKIVINAPHTRGRTCDGHGRLRAHRLTYIVRMSGARRGERKLTVCDG